MKKYRVVEYVLAEPMDRDTAMRKGLPGEYGDEANDGYSTVTCADDDGYVTEAWVPASIFEAGAQVCDSYADRLKIELNELEKRRKGLLRFLNSDEYLHNITERSRQLLKRQYAVMEEYISILKERIEELEQ